MAITTYSELQAAVANWLDRTDLTSRIPEFITLAEAKLRRDVRVRNQTSATFAVDADGETLPAGLLAIDSWYHDGPVYYGPIEVQPASKLAELKTRVGLTGAPAYAAIVGGTARFAPVPDQEYSTKITYWEGIVALSGAANWLLSAHPDIYLWATLVVAEPYVKEDERVALWKQQLEEALEELNVQTDRKQFSGQLRRTPRPIGG